jgi:hypothetical protein
MKYGLIETLILDGRGKLAKAGRGSTNEVEVKIDTSDNQKARNEDHEVLTVVFQFHDIHILDSLLKNHQDGGNGYEGNHGTFPAPYGQVDADNDHDYDDPGILQNSQDIHTPHNLVRLLKIECF